MLPSTINNTDIPEMLQHLFAVVDPTDKEVFTETERSNYIEPERKLALAVLDEAIENFKQEISYFFSYKRFRSEKLFTDVFDWFFNTPKIEKKWPYAFDNLCDMINMDSNYIRKLLILWVKQTAKGDVV